MTHPDFGCGALVLAADSEESRRQWMDVISDCSRITQENALLGASMLNRLQNKTTELEVEHEVALEKYQKEAMRLRTEKEAFEIKEAEKQRQQQDVDKLEEGMNQTEQAIKDLTSVSISKRRRAMHRIYGKHCSYRHSDFYDLIPL